MIAKSDPSQTHFWRGGSTSNVLETEYCMYTMISRATAHKVLKVLVEEKNMLFLAARAVVHIKGVGRISKVRGLYLVMTAL